MRLIETACPDRKYLAAARSWRLRTAGMPACYASYAIFCDGCKGKWHESNPHRALARSATTQLFHADYKVQETFVNRDQFFWRVCSRYFVSW